MKRLISAENPCNALLLKLLCSAVFLFIVPCTASFDSDMETLALEMAKTLKLNQHTQLCITTIDRDKSYMLSLAPVFTALTQHLQPYVSDIKMHSFRGEENAVIREIIRTSGAEYRPVRVYEPTIDSLILLGSYYLIDGSSDRIHFSVHIMNLNGQKLFQSLEYAVEKNSCPVSLQREVFSRIGNEALFSEMQYRGRVIKNLDILFNSPNNNLLAYPAQFRFENRHRYAIQWQVDALKEVLTVAYGISFSGNCSGSAILEPTGTLVFRRDSTERQIDNMVDGEPLFPAENPGGFDSLYYLYPATSESETSPRIEKKVFDTEGEITVKARIAETFSTWYPSLFSPLNNDMLDLVFADKDHPSILVGSLAASDPRIGREVIRYSWHTKKSWLAALARTQNQKERIFDVNAEVLAVFCDNLNPSRYWAIVLQNWQTKDRFRKIVYQDEGFLIVNFDFAADLSLRDFKIHYRLWFYNYRYDDVERGILRHQKLINDINSYFVAGIGGIDSTLKNAMRDFLVEKIRAAGYRCRVNSEGAAISSSNELKTGTVVRKE